MRAKSTSAIGLLFSNGVILFLSVLICSCGDSRDLLKEKLIGGFELLDPNSTGIQFKNLIEETDLKNHLFYSQIYNGAGVGVGDIDNDGLSDIFFCGNMVRDRLYLNRGNFEFEDITKEAGLMKKNGWSWGVTMADVNSDGWLDIYVSRNGESMKDLSARQNMLYINNGDLTFKEAAVEYGLADIGFSSQAVFFDFDLDGDLDLFQVNQPPDPRLFHRYKIPKERQKYHTDKLYRNDNGVFKDISAEAGVSGLAHGLSVSVADFNNDGFADMYVANDYDEPDFMYFNTGKGGFINKANQYLQHISRFSMGTDAGDINNDGMLDIMTLDMAADDHYRSKTNMASMSSDQFHRLVESGKHHQYMYNTLQINVGEKRGFQDVAHLAKLAKTDWSWSALMFDADNDGLKDIFVTNGIKKDIRNNDFRIATQETLIKGERDFLSLSQQAPSQPLSNYAYKNYGNFKFENLAEVWGFDAKGYSNGMAYGDFDNDGDLDIVINNIDETPYLYENHSNGNFLKVAFKGSEFNTLGIGAKVTVYTDGSLQVAEQYLSRGYFSSVEPGLFFGLGFAAKVDSVIVKWPENRISKFWNVQANSTLTVSYENSLPSSEPAGRKETSILTEVESSSVGVAFRHKENTYDDFSREILLPHKMSQNGPFVAKGDVNGDNLEDFFIGGAAGQSGIMYLQQTDGKFVEGRSQPWRAHRESEDMGCLLFDLDGDSDNDMLVASGGSEFEPGSPLLLDRIYVNDGAGNFKYKPKALPYISKSSQAVIASDVDRDNDLDLFIGGRLIPGKYPYPANSHLLVNDGGTFSDKTDQLIPDLNEIGLVTDATFSDVDLDGDVDLMIVGEWSDIILFENRNGFFVNSSSKWGLERTTGIWWSIEASDLDQDGDEDFVIGNLGSNNKFKASKEHPFKIYANDFDENGTNDVVLANFYDNDYVPLRGMECSSQQMPFIADKFGDYHSFASSTLSEILPEGKMHEAVSYEVDNFESILLINNGGRFQRKALPVEAQLSPLKSSAIVDIDQDGHLDVLTVGNHYPVEVETTRYDAGIGTVLLGDGKNNFVASPAASSGFFVNKDSRDIQVLKVGEENMILVANNNDLMSLFWVN